MIFNNINIPKSNQIITKNTKTLFDSKLHLNIKLTIGKPFYMIE